jgi:hypothetical protein
VFLVRFEVFTAVTMKNAVFWNVEPYRSCLKWRFGGTYRLHLQGRKIRDWGTSVSSLAQWPRILKILDYVNTGIMCLYPEQDMDMCPYVYVLLSCPEALRRTACPCPRIRKKYRSNFISAYVIGQIRMTSNFLIFTYLFLIFICSILFLFTCVWRLS